MSRRRGNGAFTAGRSYAASVPIARDPFPHTTRQLDAWLASLEERHLANLRFSEVTRALRALSAGYVERRGTLASRAPFAGAGKRAAYALFYGPLHFLTVRSILGHLPGASDPLSHLFDLGSGTGAAGAAWATFLDPPPRITAIDEHPWAVAETLATARAFGLSVDARRGDVRRVRVPRSVDGLIAGWVVNELDDEGRRELLPRLLDLAARRVRVLIVEPIATAVSPWWPEWAAAFQAAGGRADEWRFRIELPDLLRRLDKAAGMRHDELTARSLWAGY
jgi:hypothetical protein